MTIFEVFDTLNIKYQMSEHEPIDTVEKGFKVDRGLDGQHCRNFFFKGKKGYYLVTIAGEKNADSRYLRHALHDQRLHFASKEDLKSILGLLPGSVTPLSVINDTKNRVTLAFDGDLRGKKIMVHPNRNNATVLLSFEDLLKYIEFFNHKYIILDGDKVNAR